MASLTTINSTFLLSVSGLYNSPQALSGYATDDMFASGPVTIVEAQMGVDGILSAAYVAVPRKIDVTLQADSPSNAIMDNIVNAMLAAREIYWLNAIVTLPAIGMTYALRRGVLETYVPFPDARKTLQPRKYSMIFQGVVGSPTTPSVM